MISAVVLAAGLSQRMGQPKMILPWGNKVVITHVVDTLLQAGAGEVIVVTGGARMQVEQALHGRPVRCVFNPQHANGEMLRSLQVGLGEVSPAAQAVILALGDQPQIEGQVVRALVGDYLRQPVNLVVPSYQMRRGHPWLIDGSLFAELLTMQPPLTLRDFLISHTRVIRYLVVDTPSVLADLDTQEDYQNQRPKT
jgi:molybdenum cofactor cytidylyltransferase